MRMQVHSEGGFVPIPRTIVLESEKLSQHEAEEMKRLVDAAHFFDLPSQQPSSAKSADALHYTITIDEDNRNHCVHVTEPILDSHVRDLVLYAQRHVKR